jgi:hypothetical protein
MEKEFVPYELALRMKQLGFDEKCFRYYQNGFLMNDNPYLVPKNSQLLTSEKECSAPLFQQAFRWFRDSHGLWVNKTVNFHSEDNLIRGYHYNIHQAKDFIVDLNKSVEFWYFGISEEKPEITCIEKLIEIVEQNELNKQSN